MRLSGICVYKHEATAFADPENEHQIQKAFEALTKNKTVLMIAHRLSTVQDADNIIVLSGGKIAEQGSHSDLLKENGVYAAMWTDYQRSAQWKVGRKRRNPTRGYLGGYLDAQNAGQERGNPAGGYLDAQKTGQERGKEAAV